MFSFPNHIRRLRLRHARPSRCQTVRQFHGTDRLERQNFPANQGCRFQGGGGSTPALYVSHIPEQTNLLILEINNLDEPALAQNGGNGSIGFYHNGESTAVLLPVPGESYTLPSFAFKEKASRVNAAKPYPYMPPCLENSSAMKRRSKP